MLHSITGGWFSGKSSHCGIHLLYNVLFGVTTGIGMC